MNATTAAPSRTYDHVARVIRNRYIRETARPNPSWAEIASWMVQSIRPTAPPNTWRSYRNAIKAQSRDLEVADILSCPPVGGMRVAPSSKAYRSTELTSAQLRTLSDWISGRVTELGDQAILWLRATMYTGLRPVEWMSARLVTLEGGQFGVRCNTAKAREHRVLAQRTVPLTHLTEDQISEINQMLASLAPLNGDTDAFAVHYERISGFIRRCARSCFGEAGPRPTIYSGRHQFKSNCLAAGLSDAEIAVLMGHMVRKTQGKYGHLNPVSALGAPRPLQDELQAFMAMGPESPLPPENP